jgi:hypothetical protein
VYALFWRPLDAFLRDASMHKDEDDKVQMEGDLDLEEYAAFLNQGDQKDTV